MFIIIRNDKFHYISFLNKISYLLEIFRFGYFNYTQNIKIHPSELYFNKIKNILRVPETDTFEIFAKRILDGMVISENKVNTIVAI